MPQYNDMFELSIEDMELIEQALRQAMASYSIEANETNEDTIRRMHDLLGKLHDQKIFYRPKTGSYVGG
ncbi:hypothetical protein J7394_03425 [Ruegeria sp. R13_0]|uniref:hypothetical protein n=1 Tax=Ruegeria sp. R13_0 TaxID=2821099 RepID=UPI001AD97DEC|nr:hypothetical protein [Ruegeria sp. R13_0]MBO9433240.1 hypothetical protein [Ruegeria sp. R13_0]